MLDGWPIEGCVRNPGLLTRSDAAILEDALCNNRCKWVILSPDELAAWKANNLMHVENQDNCVEMDL
jgi:hypothetical protein